MLDLELDYEGARKVVGRWAGGLGRRSTLQVRLANQWSASLETVAERPWALPSASGQRSFAEGSLLLTFPMRELNVAGKNSDDPSKAALVVV